MQNNRNIIIYISGKISGLDINEAERRFNKAECDLTKTYNYLTKESPSFKGQSFTIINPLKIQRHVPGKTWEEYMLKDIKYLFRCTNIYMLRNWQDSKGARVEHAIAKELGLSIVYE